MGLVALRKILPPVPFDPATLRGRAIAVDADNLLWTFVTAFASTGETPKAPDGRPVAHLIGLVNRLKQYAAWGARSAWVFDGEQPALKAATLASREERILAAREAGGPGGIALELHEIAEAKALLTALGVPWMVAPGESDAQCACFAQNGQAWAAVTQDYDILLHGAPRALRNLTGSKTKTPELLDLDAALALAGLTREALVDAAILIGTDYNDGFPGVGPVKAVKLVKQHGTLAGALRAIGAEMPNADEVRALFLAHPVDATARLLWKAPDAGAVEKLLAERGLSADRARSVSEALRVAHGSGGQTKLF